MRLDRFISECNIGSGSKVKELVKKGFVTVDGETVKKSDINIDENKSIVLFKGKQIVYRQFVYIIMNKPAGVLTASRDKKSPTVMDLIKDKPAKDLFAVGRLDKDTTGLLLICNDGELSHRLLSPRYHVDKTYLVGCEKPVSEDDLKALEEGVDIGDDEKTLPAKACLDENGDLLLTIHEGRYHQVKRMLEAVGNCVVSLKRISFGSLLLPDDLKEGEWRELSKDEIDTIVFK